MLLSLQKDTEDLIIECLKNGPLPTATLLEQIANTRGVSKYGVYKSLRKLRASEVIVEYKKVISLSIPWVHRMSQFTDTAIQGYSLSNYGYFLGLENGKRMVFSFQDLVGFDTYWMHMMITLMQRYDEPLYLYAKHDWFVVVRPEAKSDLFNWIEMNRRSSFMLIGSNSPLDFVAGEKSKLSTMQVAVIEKNLFGDHPYGAVIGDYIIESRFEKSIVSEIDNLYYENQSLDILKKRLIDITSKDQVVKIIVTRKKEEALRLRKKMSKYFYIPKEIRSKV